MANLFLSVHVFDGFGYMYMMDAASEEYFTDAGCQFCDESGLPRNLSILRGLLHEWNKHNEPPEEGPVRKLRVENPLNRPMGRTRWHHPLLVLIFGTLF
jgi:hypothetical protein